MMGVCACWTGVGSLGANRFVVVGDPPFRCVETAPDKLADLMDALPERRAKRASQGRFFSAQREHGTALSQPVFALAQLIQAMGVRPAMDGTVPGAVCIGSLASWYVKWWRWRRSLL